MHHPPSLFSAQTSNSQIICSQAELLLLQLSFENFGNGSLKKSHVSVVFDKGGNTVCVCVCVGREREVCVCVCVCVCVSERESV